MNTTSHFVWIELKSIFFSNIFVKIYKYLKNNNILDIINFQNPLSLHITLYYFEKDLGDDREIIKKYITEIDINEDIFVNWIDYFNDWDDNKSILYLKSTTKLDLKLYRDSFYLKFNRNYIKDNSFDYSPHITLLRILDSNCFEKHRQNIESIINNEIQNIANENINNKKIFLYAVNSEFKEEIQIKL